MENSRTTTHGFAIPLSGNEIDTDRIIPARFMKCVTFDGLGEYAFYDERFTDQKKEKVHPFNDPKFKSGTILVVNKNFGCGSSREHAPQALARYGINAIIGESFAEIFRGNCVTMGIPAVTLDQQSLEQFQKDITNSPQLKVTISLADKTVRYGEKILKCEIPETFRSALSDGIWDSTAELLAEKNKITETVKRIPYINGFV